MSWPFALDRPLLALVLVVGGCALTVLLARGSRAEGSPGRRRTALVLRCALVALLALALAGLQHRRERDGMTVVFAVDSSDSTRGAPRERARRHVVEAASSMSPDDQVAVVQFGRDALVEEDVRDDLRELALASTPRPDGSDLGAALRLSRGLLPPEGRRRIVVLTDGEVDGEDPAGAVREALDAGIDVQLVPLTTERGPEVLVEDVVAPERVHEGEPYSVRIVLRSSHESNGTLTVTRNGELVAQEELTVGAGRPTVFRLVERHSETGTHRYRAHFDGEPDGFTQNDAAEALVRVEGQPSILVVDPEPARLSALQALVEASGFSARIAGIEALPQTLTDAARWQSIVLSDVDSLSLSTRQMRVLQAHVREGGGGLVMAGGPNSFGPGGWYATPVEEALPVDMDVRNEKYYPSLALFALLDKSGSMAGSDGASKMDLAKEAAALAIELLHPSDRAAVVAFDSAAKWVVKPSGMDERESVLAQLRTLQAGGGTDIYPALVVANEALAEERTVLKHVILLSDGRSPPRDFAGLIGKMTAAGITLSSVAVGSDADLYTMERLADLGAGRYYFTEDPASIPRIFTKEAFTTARSFTVEESFAPEVVLPHPVLRGAAGLPGLDGYVATTAKPSAELVLRSHREDPVLAFRRYGLGRSMAFTSDLGQRWATAWLGSGAGRTVLAQSLRWVSRRADSSQLRLEIDRRDGELHVAVEARDDAGDFLNFAQFQARVSSPDLESFELGLRQVAPGRYAGSVPARRSGAWFVAVAQVQDERTVRGTSAARVFPYSDEYRLLRPGDAVARLANRSGAAVAPEAATAFVRQGAPGVTLAPAWRELILLSSILLLLDVAFRRVMLPHGWPRKVAAWLRPGRAAAETTGGLSRLRGAKERTRARIEPRRPRPAERASGAAEQPSPAEPAPRSRPSLETGRDTAPPRRQPEPSTSAPSPPEDADDGGPAGFGGRLLEAKRRARRGSSPPRDG